MTLDLVPFRGHTVPVLNGKSEISRYSMQQYLNDRTFSFNGMTYHPGNSYGIVTTYNNKPAEPISYNFAGFVEGMLYADGPVAAAEGYRLRVFGQAPLLYQELVDGRPGDLFDDDALERLREPWPSGNLGDLMKRALIYGDFAGNAFVLDIDDELVLVRPDWVEILLAKREFRGGQVGWRQMGIVYYEGGLHVGDGVPFLPGEYCHFVPGLPDPLAAYRGMSWLTPLIREVQSDKSAMDHKVAFFSNAATPNLAVSLPKEITPEQFRKFVDEMDEKHKGPLQAGKTLYTAGGADVTVIGANMKEMDFSSVMGKSETRIANAAGVPPVLLSFSEGMQGSSLNAGNYTAAKRNFVDTTMRDLWQNWAGSLQKMDAFRPPKAKARLWYDGRDIPFLHEDAKDRAEIQQIEASTLSSHISAGWKPDSAVLALLNDDLKVLEHTGLTSVQLVPPGTTDADGDGVDDAEGEYDALLDEFRAQLADEDEIQRDRYDVRNPRGSVGGGRFRKLSDAIVALLKDWDGDGDPLADFTQPQLKKAAIQLGIDVPPRSSAPKIKASILKKLRGDGPDTDAPDAKPVKKAAPKKRAPLSAVDKDGKSIPVPSKEERDREILGDEEYERRQAEKAPAKKATPRAPAKKAAPKAADAVTGQAALDLAGSRGGRPDYTLEVTGDPGWTDAQRAERAEALRVYSSEVDPSRGDSAEMQAQLRGLASERDYADDVALIDDVMAHSPLPAEVLTFRGVSAEDFARHGDGELVGREWTELGYSSTSPIQSRAESYADSYSRDSGVLLSIRVPAGTGAVAINPRGPGHTEKELVLERGLTYRVTGDRGMVTIDGGGNPVRVLDVEVVPRDTPDPDPESSARQRQADIDTARKYSAVAGELSEFLDAEADPEVTARRLRQEARRQGIADEVEPIAAAVESAREIEVENRIRAAYRAVLADRPARRRGDRRLLPWVSMADLRDQLGNDLPRDEVDRVLDRMIEQPDVRLQQELNQRALTDRDRVASVVIGNQPRDIIQIENPSDRPTPDARALTAALLERHGITPDNAAGDTARFTPGAHTAIGAPIRQGAPVRVVRPGFTLERDGEKIRVAKAVVEEVDGPSARHIADSAVLSNPDNLGGAVDLRLTKAERDARLREANQRIDETIGLIDFEAMSPTTLRERERRQAAGGRVQGRNRLAQIRADAASIRSADSRADTFDTEMAEIGRRQGFDAKPRVASEPEMDAAVADGWVEVWRGIKDGRGGSAAEIAERLRTGGYEPGKSSGYGAGIYTSVDRHVAEAYRGADITFDRDHKPTGASGGAEGGLVRMALDPSARVADYDESVEQWRAAQADMTPDERAVLGDLGRYLAAQGFDAIRVRGHGDGFSISDPPDQYVILNRSALMVQAPDGGATPDPLSDLRTLDPEAARDALDLPVGPDTRKRGGVQVNDELLDSDIEDGEIIVDRDSLRRVEEAKTVADLRQIARDRQIKIPSRVRTKKDIRDLLRDELRLRPAEDVRDYFARTGGRPGSGHLHPGDSPTEAREPVGRPSGLPTDRKPESGDFDDLADRIGLIPRREKTEERVMEILEDLNKTELRRLARKFPGVTTMHVASVGGTVSATSAGLRIPDGMTVEEMRRWLAQQLTSQRFHWRSQAPDPDDIERADYDESEPGEPNDEILRALADLTDDEFEKYWTREPEGLARWATHAHPWTTLRNLLRQIPLKHGRGPRDPEGLASHYFKVVFGIWPGERKGDNPVGPG